LFINPKIYIETSIVSHYTARPSRDLVVAAHQQITHEWWDNKRFDFEMQVMNHRLLPLPKNFLENEIMWTDPIIEELHKIRKDHAAKFNFNLLAIVRDYQKQQKESGKKVVSFVKKREFVSANAELAEA